LKSVAVFFDLTFFFTNQGPKAGGIGELKLGPLSPEPDTQKRDLGEKDKLNFQFRFHGEEATNAPLTALPIEAGSSKTVTVSCALGKTSQVPRSSYPILDVNKLMETPLRIRLLYKVTTKKGLSSRTADCEIKLVPALYDQARIDDYRKFLRI